VEEDAFLVSRQALCDFLQPAGDGEKLHQKLIDISREQNSHWLTPLWHEQYLAYRGRLAGSLNYYVVLDNERFAARHTVATLAAGLVDALTREYLDVVSRRLPVERLDGRPLCMSQYDRMFKAVRLPLPQKDRYILYPPADPHHVVVFYRNRLYQVNVTDGQGKPLSTDGLASQIQRLMNEARPDQGPGVGVLTTACRDDAAQIYEAIAQDPVNQQSLDVIRTALFVLCIDPKTEDRQSLQKRMLLSTGRNRYFDKSCQIILTENLEIGFNGEHTAVDGTPWFQLLNRVVDRLAGEGTAVAAPAAATMPEELAWNVTGEIRTALGRMLAEHQAVADSLYVDHLDFRHYGKEQIKQWGMSPDAFFQVVLQLAQFRTFGQLRSTYESVSMRHFAQGRTECARAVHGETLRFVRAACTEPDAGGELKSLFLEAQRAHTERIRQCREGLGIERHLFALRSVYEEQGASLGIDHRPALFDSPGYRQLTHDFISTSGAGSGNISLFGFGPVTDDGYGIGYVIRDDSLHVTLSTHRVHREKGIQLLHHLEEGLQKARRMS
jgi:carnitine O-acetyltransferase